MTIPVRLDARLLGQRRISRKNEDAQQFLVGVWLLITAVLGVMFALLNLAFDQWSVGVLSAVTTAVPGSMAILRGVVDGISPRRQLPKYTTDTGTWLMCYAVAVGGFGVAFLA